MLAFLVVALFISRVGASSPLLSQEKAPLAIPELPVLTFAGPDWVNVKSPPFNAKGDGITDDTAAIQKALSIMGKSYQNNTVFFPAGTYKITRTLLINSTLGTAIYGTGRTTVLKWGAGKGPTPPATTLLGIQWPPAPPSTLLKGSWPPSPPANVSRMFWSIGNTRFTMEGMVLDGADGQCGVGFDHASLCLDPNHKGFCGAYESGVTHRHLHFKNFFVAGIRVGTSQPPHGIDTASAEIQYTNNIFEGNRAGLSFLAWNDFDNAVSGCLFVNNAYGIECIAGNFYVQNTRFQNSSVTDATITAHSSSIRRVVSVGSAAFLLQTDNNNFNGAMKVVESLITGWGSAANPSAAILYQTRGPVMLIDSVFDSPANPSSPVLALRNTTWTGPDSGVPYVGYGGAWSSVVAINATTRGAAGPLLDVNSTAAMVAGGHFYTDFPPGDPAMAARLAPLSANTQFFNPAWPQPTKVFDAVAQYGAHNDGKETSKQLQACIDAAAGVAGGLCYLQDGQYNVNTTLRLCGGSTGFTLMGSNSGFRTMLHWFGNANNDSVVMAAGPAAGCTSGTNVTLKRFTVQVEATATVVISRTPTIPASYTGKDNAGNPKYQAHGEIHLPGGGSQSGAVHVVLDNLYTVQNRLVISGLQAGDTVTGPKLDGDWEVWDSDAAVVLLSFSQLGGTGVTVARSPGASIPSAAERAAGFCGAAVGVAAEAMFDYRLYNSSSFVLGSHYTGDGTSPPGIVAIDHSKLNHYWQENGVYLPSWHFNNWEGTALTHGATGAGNMVFHSEGSASPQIAMLGWIVEDFNTTFSTTPSTVIHALGNIIAPYEGAPPYTMQAYFADIVHPTSKQVMQAALDRLRYMGILDLAINYPHAQY